MLQNACRDFPRAILLLIEINLDRTISILYSLTWPFTLPCLLPAPTRPPRLTAQLPVCGFAPHLGVVISFSVFLYKTILKQEIEKSFPILFDFFVLSVVSYASKIDYSHH